MNFSSIESIFCQKYLEASQNEMLLEDWAHRIDGFDSDVGIIVTQGFEERSVGFIEGLRDLGKTVSTVVIGQHKLHTEANSKYHSRFKAAATAVATKSCLTVNLTSEGSWIEEALSSIDAHTIILDITGVGTRGLFGALDAVAKCDKKVLIAYTEAKEYWPKVSHWEALQKELSDTNALPDIVDQKPWLFGYEHNVELIPGHEGYDSAGAERALVGFLPYKYARLAAVMCAEEYGAFLFIGGRPRLSENSWRYEALLEINRDIVKDRQVVEISTFGYRAALQKLHDLLIVDESLIEKYDIHIALMGSKLQDVACWILSCLIPSLTILTAVPQKYFDGAFSDGIGSRWIFPLTPP